VISTPVAYVTATEERLQRFPRSDNLPPHSGGFWGTGIWLLSPANLPKPAHPADRGRTATTFGPLCQARRTSPRGARRTEVDRLPHQGEEAVLGGMASAGVVEFDCRCAGQREDIVEFTIGKESGIAGNGGTTRLYRMAQASERRSLTSAVAERAAS
jgi:hypothetical protein